MAIFAPASKPVASYNEWDPRYPAVVRSIMADVGDLPSGVAMDHIGSTSIPHCAGKGVIDLMALYAEGELEATKAWLFSLGLGRQGPEFARPWRDARPMLLGTYLYDQRPFLIYVHVLNATSDEVRRFRDFRELLRARPDLVAQYTALKRAILADGVTDTDEYAVRKRAFMRQALGPLHRLRDVGV